MEETLSTELYKLYGISEWHEKKLLMDLADTEQVLRDLKAGTPSVLAAIITFPFPEFVKAYFKSSVLYEQVFADPSIAYKVYFLNDTNLRFFGIYMRNPHEKMSTIGHLHNIKNPTEVMKEIKTTLARKLSSFAVSTSRAQKIKFVYLTQYIDRSKLVSLSLDEPLHIDALENDGFEFEQKLSSLPPQVEKALRLHLGFYGNDSLSVDKVAETLNINRLYMRDLLARLLDLVLKPTNEFLKELKEHPELFNKKPTFNKS